MTRGMGRRSLALTAAATLTLGGLVFAAPAVAAETTPAPTPTASSTPEASSTPAAKETAAPKETEAPETKITEEQVDKAADEAAAAEVEIVAVGVNAQGDDVIVVTEDSVATSKGENAVDAFADSVDAKNAEIVTVPAALEAWAEGDVVGGQGYMTETGGACSIGFSAYTPDGAPALLSAGHCAFDENGDKTSLTALTVPSEEPAVGGPGWVLPEPTVILGEFGFAQFGGPGYTSGAEKDPTSIDISVIDINEAGGWNPLPAVTDWSTAGEALDSLAEGSVKVTSVGEPTYGSVSKSGRTTGFTTGTIDPSLDILDGWAEIVDGNGNGHWVRGFSSDVEGAPGDSGGAVIQGNTAVGLISGGKPGVFTWAASLTKSLEFTDGYTVALSIDKPKIDAGDTAVRGDVITGTVPSNNAKSVIITRDGGEPTSVDVVDGKFSFKLENKGEFSYTFTAVNGYSRSATTTWDVKVVPPAVAAPVITSPADGSTLAAPLTSISGTGVAGHTVEVSLGDDSSGDSFAPVTVAEDGTWTIDGLSVESYGEYTVTAQQFRNADEFSSVVKSTFTLAPAAPAITSIFDGQVFGPTAGPTGLSGTGIEGATVKVALNGVDAASATAVAALAAESGSYRATVVDGKWSIDFEAALEPGSYTVRAVQTVDGVNSATAAELAFSVSAPAPAPAPAPGGNGGGEAPSAGGDGELATTGMDTTVTLTASAGALALISAGIVLLIVRRRKLVQD